MCYATKKTTDLFRFSLSHVCNPIHPSAAQRCSHVWLKNFIFALNSATFAYFVTFVLLSTHLVFDDIFFFLPLHLFRLFYFESIFYFIFFLFYIECFILRFIFYFGCLLCLTFHLLLKFPLISLFIFN